LKNSSHTHRKKIKISIKRKYIKINPHPFFPLPSFSLGTAILRIFFNISRIKPYYHFVVARRTFVPVLLIHYTVRFIPHTHKHTPLKFYAARSFRKIVCNIVNGSKIKFTFIDLTLVVFEEQTKFGVTGDSPVMGGLRKVVNGNAR
jgi:hypothetical protein